MDIECSTISEAGGLRLCPPEARSYRMFGNYSYIVHGKILVWEKIGEFGEQNAIRQCFTCICLLLLFVISCTYTRSSFTNNLASNWFGLAYSPIFSPTKIFPRTVYQKYSYTVEHNS